MAVKSPLADKLKNAKPKGAPPNAIDKLLEKLKKEDPAAHRELLNALKDRDRVSNRALSEILTDAGHPVGNTQVHSWRHKNLRKRDGSE